ncbi:hypothetical protein TBLA_0A05210 [Henningerozyma blattae CBS 6284]|uniref:Carboxypeptidase Y inhibitor n=1 Tax=Henningerozyma blattae (strain ATCC 34711 / CBS 6284 / DSM 70876 / NBRC 10599 / NRRL Y-10934 / UCD 77-7) TaxID=1071380 RepID=I2GW12_HENB6|nr:hypothetical protein TBLA_0A05210 [Tetrapisispora blattae CBS 6284]CCH58314.1 hypothetical protein TBLA_0A05210 [Tetrapisispora blattae CBS 6284]
MMHALDASQASVEGLAKHDILKDVIKDINFKPWGYITGQFSVNAPISMGNTLDIEETKLRPQLQFVADPKESGIPKINDSDLFTLVMTDPDAPSRTDKKWSEFCHYIEGDIKLLQENQHTTGGVVTDPQFFATSIANGNVLQSYHPPGPPKGTGKHRYVLILYKQPPRTSSSQFTKVTGRPNWGYGTPATGVHKWATENKLEPIAANFFLVQQP